MNVVALLVQTSNWVFVVSMVVIQNQSTSSKHVECNMFLALHSVYLLLVWLLHKLQLRQEKQVDVDVVVAATKKLAN